MKYWKNLGGGGRDWLPVEEKTFFNMLRLAFRDKRPDHFLIEYESHAFHIIPKGRKGEIHRTHAKLADL